MEGEVAPDIPLLDGDVVEVILHAYMRRTTDEDERHEPEVGVYHSSSGATCLRRRWYSDNGVSGDSFGDGAHGIFERGDRVEEFVTDALLWGAENPEKLREIDGGVIDEEVVEILEEADVRNSKGWNIQVDEFPGVPEYRMVGSTDPYITVPVKVAYDGIEVESGKMVALCEVKSKGEIGDAEKLPEFHHQIQLNTYLNALDMDYGLFIYVGARDFDDYHVIEFERDDAMWEVTKALHGVYHWYRYNDKLPPKLPVSEGECEWCPYRTLCAKDRRGDEFRDGVPYPELEELENE